MEARAEDDAETRRRISKPTSASCIAWTWSSAEGGERFLCDCGGVLICACRNDTSHCNMAKRAVDLKQLRELPIEERLKAVEELWDSIAEEDPDLAMPITPSLIEELDQRLAEHRADPAAVIPWEQVRDELVTRLRRRRR